MRVVTGSGDRPHRTQVHERLTLTNPARWRRVQPRCFRRCELAQQSTTKTSNSAIAHVRQLDGIRGSAILLVLFCHFYYFEGVKAYLDSTSLKTVWSLAGSGWLGVDLFFVLSGFLISTILFNTKESPSYFKSFYGRRVLRIFPLYFLVLLLYFHGPMSIFTGHDKRCGPGHEIWFWLYFANWKIGFWPLDELSHLWSLCVEEQFYFVWPLVVWVTGKRTFPWVCLGVIAACIGCGVGYEFAGLPDGLVLGATLPRAQAIVFGALMAWLVRQSWLSRVTSQLKLILPAAFGLLLVCALTPPFFRSFRTLEMFIASVAWSALLLQCITRSDGIFARIMRTPVLCSFGKFSYAIYVLNQFVYFHVGNFAFDTLKPYVSSDPLLLALLFIAMVGGAYLAGFFSWHLFEKHFLGLKKYFPYEAGPPVADSESLAAVATGD